MRYKEISLNGLYSTSGIVDELMEKVEDLYDFYDDEYVELFESTPVVDIELNYGERDGFLTLDIDLILDRNIQPFYIYTENISGVNDDGLNFSKLDKSIKELFFRELKKLDELYKK